MFENDKIDPDNIPIWLKKFWSKANYKNIFAGINDDDCAIIKLGNKTKIIITTDFLNANPISVELGICNNYDLGRLIVASNISDLCGTGAEPIAFLLGVTMLNSDKNEELYSLFEGVRYELNKISIPLIGGDTKLGKARAFIGTAIGYADEKRKLFLKNSAKPNDILWVSGKTGSVSASVFGISKSLMDENWTNEAKRYILNSDVPIQKSELVALSKIANGGTDISDGLGADLNDMLDSSGVGAEVYAELIPFNSLVSELAQKIQIEPWMFSFVIGGDFQFLITSNSKYKRQMKEFGFTEIGKITEKREKLLIYNNKKVDLPSYGHRDKRGLRFSDEVSLILDDLNHKINNND